MLTFLLALYIVIVIALWILAFAVAARNWKQPLNKAYLYVCIAISGWILTNYFSNDLALGEPVALWVNKVVLLAGGVSVLAVLNFVLIIGGKKSASELRSIIGLIGGIGFLSTLTPWVVEGVSKQQHVYAIHFGFLAPFYFVELLAVIAAIITIVISGARHNIGVQRDRLTTILYSLIAMAAILVTTNVLLPTLSGSFVLTYIGPLSSLFLVVGLLYSMIRHKLFDIRFFVVRAAAYTTSVILLSALYIVPSILLVAWMMNIHFTWPRFWAGVGVALLAAIFYGLVREKFDNLTNRAFFRSYYEPQDVLDKLSDVLVRTADVKSLQTQSRQIIAEALKTRDLQFRLLGHDDLSGKDLPQVFSGRHSPSVIVVDEIENKPELVQKLRDNDIAVAVRLRTNRGELGFMTLGFKESGELYNSRDKRLLGIAADEIAISLQNALHFEEIQNFNKTLQGRVNEATKEIRRSNEKLKALDETKDDFISMASHQLRTPLTSVKGYLSLVLEGDAGKISDQQKQLLNQAFTSSQRMVYLISDLLNVSRLKTGKFIIETTEVNLADMISEEIAQLTETAQSRSIELRYDKPKDFPPLLLDETKTRQVIMNFIDNAIYYTPAGGHITVELSDKPATVELRVMDDGIGVPRSEQHHLFTKFYRAGNARKARPDGTGLGLFMAKKVISAQGGALIFESQEGKGSTFGFTFSKSKLNADSGAKSEPEKELAAAN